jgi:hypothetical protein
MVEAWFSLPVLNSKLHVSDVKGQSLCIRSPSAILVPDELEESASLFA